MDTYKISFIVLVTILFLDYGRSVLKYENPCSKLYVPCENGQCISVGYWCDDEIDCKDESDEIFCGKVDSRNCTDKHFKCGDGKCLPIFVRCNGWIECDDDSDEKNCDDLDEPTSISTSETHNFQTTTTSTTTTEMYTSSFFCNGIIDCSNRTDEKDCGTRNFLPHRPKTESAAAWNRTALKKVKMWIDQQKNEKSSTEKWGSNVGSLVLIHYFTNDDNTFKGLFFNKEEIVYELSIQLLSQLSHMKLEDIPSTELASYVNAFLVTCINPRKFYGHDIIQELRNRVDQKNYTNPYVLLALCNAGETITESDKNKLIETFQKRHRTFWADMQAVVVMALACASKQQSNEADSETLRWMTQELKQRQFRNGTIVNLPTTALVMQALLSTNSENDPNNFNQVKAFEELLRNQKSDGSFGDLMNTFLVAPVLTCKSLMDINSNHCQYESTDESLTLKNILRRRDPKIRVQYSLWIGNNKDIERNLILRVPQNFTLYSVMETAADVDSRFKSEYSVKDRKPYINAISGMRDNPLTGKFWFLYVIQDEKPVLENKSPTDIVPKDGDHFVMWYRRGTWVD